MYRRGFFPRNFMAAFFLQVSTKSNYYHFIPTKKLDYIKFPTSKDRLLKQWNFLPYFPDLKFPPQKCLAMTLWWSWGSARLLVINDSHGSPPLQQHKSCSCFILFFSSRCNNFILSRRPGRAIVAKNSTWNLPHREKSNSMLRNSGMKG